MEDHLKSLIEQATDILERMEPDQRIEALNDVRQSLHRISPFRQEPVDCVIWVRSESIVANDYNPNTVAPPEMRLLELSIVADGYTQPVVTAPEGDINSVVDGYHRTFVGKQSADVRERTGGYIPITRINPDRDGRADRIAATIRHNRARGKHGVDAMSAIVIELARRNWTDKKIGRELGMEPDEVLRLKQIGGMADVFADREFSKAWEIDEAAIHD